MSPPRKTAIVIGAGPAGLTAAWELLDRTEVTPIVLEMSGEIGGLSRTVSYKGNRIDIGGHRFFSKSDRVMAWWRNVLPLQGAPARDDRALGRDVPLVTRCALRPLGSRKALEQPAPDPERDDDVMLVRRRLSRILYGRKMYDYPISLGTAAIRNLGLARTCAIGASYLKASLFPVRPEKSLEDFFVNRFGRELYGTFFRDYTEKVWGVPCSAIKPEWGAQRVKGLSIAKAIGHAAKRVLSRGPTSVEQKGTETSLIEQFLYPKLGPGQLWEEVARAIRAKGGEINLHQEVVGIACDGTGLTSVRTRDLRTGVEAEWNGDYFFSSMPVRQLIGAMPGPVVPAEVRSVAEGLSYRDFITVGLLLDRLEARNDTAIPTVGDIIPDNWIYVQESDVKLGRVQVFNNWSPYLVADPRTVWLGLEYFCNEGDDLWRSSDQELVALAGRELAAIGLAAPRAILDGVVLRVPKAYPAYFGSYDRFDVVREFTDSFTNLFLVGRNGMHRYNNTDHSMLAAMAAVDAVASGSGSHDEIWSVNAEEDYHESRR
jgi:protoporphyrinogen oxidase